MRYGAICFDRLHRIFTYITIQNHITSRSILVLSKIKIEQTINRCARSVLTITPLEVSRNPMWNPNQQINPE